MSAKVMGQVFDLDLPHPELLVLLAMADHAEHDGSDVYPSMGLIAWKVGYSVRQVHRIVDKLVGRGLLILEDDRRGRGNTNVYSVRVGAGPQKTPYDGRERLDDVRRLELRAQLLERDGAVCHYCGKGGDQTNGPDGSCWHIDRVIPGAEGGRYELDNVVLACRPCNIRKGPNKRRHHVGSDKMSRPIPVTRDTERLTRDTSSDGGGQNGTTGMTSETVGRDIQMADEPSGKNRPEESSEKPSIEPPRARARAREADLDGPRCERCGGDGAYSQIGKVRMCLTCAKAETNGASEPSSARASPVSVQPDANPPPDPAWIAREHARRTARRKPEEAPVP